MPDFPAIWEAQRPVRALWLPVSFGTGIGIYFALKVEPAAGVVSFLAVFGALALIAGLRLGFLLALIGIGCLGFANAAWRTERVGAPVLGWYYYGPVEGRVVGVDRSASNALRITLDRVYLPGVAVERTPARVRFSMHGEVAEAVPEAGARVAGQVRLGPPGAPVEPGGFDFRKYAWFHRLGAVGYARDPVVTIGPPEVSGVAVRLLALRMAMADAIRAHMPERTGAFAAAILTGDRSAIDPDLLVDLRASNLAHLLAISGLHMGLLTGIVFAAIRYGLALVPMVALRVPAKKIAAGVALVAGFGYLALSGAAVATERAFIMAAVVLVAVMLDRPAFTLRAVAIAAMIVLIRTPESLTEAGFQMSFAATTALVAGFNELRRYPWWQGLAYGRGRWVRPVLMVAFTSAVAGMATAPFSAFHFNQFSQFGLLANVLAVPVMGMVVMPAAVLTFCLWPLGLSGIGFWLMDRGIAFILWVAGWVAGLDGALRLVPSGPPMVLALVSLGGLFLLLWQGRLRFAGIVPVAVALVMWHGTERPDVLISENGRLVGVLGTEGRALNVARGHGFAAETWLENDGDAVDQAAAAERPMTERGRQETRVALAGFGELVWLNAAEPGPEPCAAGTLVVAPKWEAAPEGACVFIGKAALEREGATAIWVEEEGLRSLGANPVAGRRPWTLR